MTVPKRKPGRPRGSSRYAITDSRLLDEVAALLACDRKMKKTPAITKIAKKHFPEHQRAAAVRRLLTRWNRSEKERLEAAEEERRERHSRTLPSAPHRPVADTASSLAAALGHGADILGAAEAAQKAWEATQRPWLALDLNTIEGAIAANAGLDSPTMREAMRMAEDQTRQMAAIEGMLPRLESIAAQVQSSEFLSAVDRAMGEAQRVQRLMDQIGPPQRLWGL